MPFYRWRRPRWRRRFRWFPRRRTRYAFRTRRWRKRRRNYYGVRKRYNRKLSKITVREWQPETIKKAIVKGIYPLFLSTHARLSHNLIQYIDSIAPEHWPGGGGFSITCFTLEGLYELFIKAQNWWTKSNCYLPLIRYNFCRLKFYKAENYDYIVRIYRCTPLKSSDEMYMSTHPAIMMITKKAIFVPCKKYNRNKKNYKIINVKPPTQMKSNWHFQKDICKAPLLLITATAASFDRMYTSSSAQSTTIGFTSLNTKSFIFHDWQEPPTTGYKPQENQWLWGSITPLTGTQTPNDVQLSQLAYLGGTGPYELGIPVKTQNADTYGSTSSQWGNIFRKEYLSGANPVYITNKTVQQLATYIKTHSQEKVSLCTDITPKTTANLVKCRYNPLNDRGKGNKVYLVSNHSDHTQWHPPDNPSLTRQDLPLWLLTWGWMDWQKKNAKTSQPDINYMTVIISPYITPQLPYYLLLDDSFLNGLSPYQSQRTASDEKHFYPKNNFQVVSLNNLATSGPGTVKLPPLQSCEAHFEYKFHFKLGGCPPPMDKICDPADQPIYPLPNSKQTTPSLQSPAMPIQTYMYDFDQRRDTLTERAAKRIKKDFTDEKTLFQIAGTSAMDLPAPHQETPTPTSASDSEEEEKDLQLQLRHLRRKQRHLRDRILQLLNVQSLE